MRSISSIFLVVIFIPFEFESADKKCKTDQKATNLLFTRWSKITLTREGVQCRHEPCEITSGASWYAEWHPSPAETDWQRLGDVARGTETVFAVFEVILRIRRLHGEVISRGSWRLCTPSLMKRTISTILRVLQYINIYILKSSLIRFLLFLTGNCLKLEFSFFKLTESLN